MSKTKELFWTFFKIGAFTFGGGYAMLPILQREVVEKKGWATEEAAMPWWLCCKMNLWKRKSG